MTILVALVLLPLAIIGGQIALGADGALANSVYKLAFIVPPVLYCRWQGISLPREIFRWQNWRNELGLALALGLAASAIFLGAYWVWSDLLLDKSAITAKIDQQFSVTPGTVLLIAPFTILINSLIEEFFYRGFASGQLSQRNLALGMLLPAAVFTAQHLLFIYHWVTPLPLALAIVALTVFALAMQWLYARADSIVAPWLVHILGDLAMMTIAMQLVWI